MSIMFLPCILCIMRGAFVLEYIGYVGKDKSIYFLIELNDSDMSIVDFQPSLHHMEQGISILEQLSRFLHL